MRTLLQSVALTSAILLLPGCDNGDAAKFNDAVVSSYEQLSDAVTAFDQTVAKALEQKTPKMDDVRDAYKKYGDTLARVKAEAPTWKVPSSKNAQKMLSCYNNLMIIHEDIFKECAEIIKILENKELRKNERAKKIGSLLDERDRRELPVFGDLQDAQRAFAREQHIKLMERKKKT